MLLKLVKHHFYDKKSLYGKLSIEQFRIFKQGMETMNYYVKAKTFLLEDGVKENAYLKVEDGKFSAFVDTVPANAEVLDYSGYTVAPGLFDTHVHGINGFDVMDGTKEAIKEMSLAMLPLGVTRFLPTTLTSSKEALEKAIVSVKEATNEGLKGAQSAGIYLEGPFFTDKYKGAQNPQYFLDPNREDFDYWQKLADGTIVKIALAPEREGSLPFIKQITDEGVKVALGHTDASYECCGDAVDHGANIFVHLFNGMSGLHHRNPGVAGAALINEKAFAELICDGHHVHPDVATFAYKQKQDKLALITDCMRAGLLEDGQYKLGEFDVTMKDGIARMDNGSLAGSTLLLIDGVRNLHQWSGESLSKIWHLASLSPAKSLEMDHNYGSIAEGKVADFVVLNDDINVQATVLAGEVLYEQ